MPLKHTKTIEITTTAADGCVRLFHGTRSHMAESIMEFGVDAERAKACGGGQGFNAATDYEMAQWYSSRPNEPGSSAIIAFDLTNESMDRMVKGGMVQDRQSHGFHRFLPKSYAVLNAEMSNIELKIE